MKLVQYILRTRTLLLVLLGFIISWSLREKITPILLSGKGFDGRNIFLKMLLMGSYIFIISSALIAFIYLICKYEKKSPKRLFVITGGLTGALMFVYFYGLHTLNVTNINWLLNAGDLTQHYISWVFFRNDPWTFPIGMTQSLGYPFGTSISFTDSIPLFALFFKLFSGILPTPFQYFGIWTMFCFILQGIFASLIIYQTTHNLPATIISPLFFCMSNIFHHRIFSQSSLVGQWIILLAIYFYILNKTGKKSNNYWPLILCLALLIHPYFLGMVSVIFIATLIERFKSDRNILDIIIFCISSFASVSICMWLIGIFTGDVKFYGSGIGYLQANINAFYNPIQNHYSAFIKPIHNFVSSEEGFNYLGFGMILLVITAFFSILVSLKKFSFRKISDNIGIIFIVVVLTIISLSNVITFNELRLFSYFFPLNIMKVWSVFQATGRMLWPVFYLIFIFAISQNTIYLKENWKIILALGLGFLIQYADASQLILSRTYLTHPNGKSNILTSNFWTDAAHKYKTVLVLPLDMSDWQSIGDFASQNHVNLNFFYFARGNSNLSNYANEKIAMLKLGKTSPAELYIIKDPNLRDSLCNVIPEDTFFANVNGLWVIAPGLNRTPEDYTGIIQIREDGCN